MNDSDEWLNRMLGVIFSVAAVTLLIFIFYAGQAIGESRVLEHCHQYGKYIADEKHVYECKEIKP